MKKWILEGVQIIIAYFATVLLVFILRKLGLISASSSAWIIAAAAIVGSLIGVCILQVYKLLKKFVNKKHEI